MAITAELLHSLVPISQFNKGQAAKIFDRLRSEKELIVLKNNQPSAVILSPEEYTRLTEIEELSEHKNIVAITLGGSRASGIVGLYNLLFGQRYNFKNFI